MRHRFLLPVFLFACRTHHAQDMSAFLPKVSSLESRLLPGEGLALAVEGEHVQGFGDVRSPSPMGGLAGLLWLQTYGDEWGYQRLQFRCTGAWNGFACSHAKGHGTVDLASALEQDCRMALLAWSSESILQTKAEYGDGVSRARLEDVFRAFMVPRPPVGGKLPPFGPVWVGEGSLLQATPEQFVKWLVDPGQERVKVKAPNLLIPLLKRESGPQWWIKVAAVPVSAKPESGATWVVGADGMRTAVLRMPKVRTKAEALARFKTLVGAGK